MLGRRKKSCEMEKDTETLEADRKTGKERQGWRLNRNRHQSQGPGETEIGREKDRGTEEGTRRKRSRTERKEGKALVRVGEGG